MGEGIHTVPYLKGVEQAGVGVAVVSPTPGIKQEAESNGGPLSPCLLLLSPFPFHTTLSNTTLRVNNIHISPLGHQERDPSASPVAP